MENYLRLSPNEQAAYERSKELEYRKQRLLALRQSERVRAREQSQRYEVEYQQALKMILDNVKIDWDEYKEKEIEALEVALRNSLDQIGRGYEDAQKVTIQEIMRSKQFKDVLLRQLKVENERSTKAGIATREERQAQEQPHQEYIEHLEQVRINEQKRATNIARMYRLTHPQDILCPHDAAPVPTQFQSRFDRANAHPLLKYDDTYYNKNYAVIKADSETPHRGPNAVQMADIVLQRIQKEEEAKQQRLKQYDQKAQERFGNAIYSVQMEREKVEMMRELDKIQQADRRRKQLLLDQRSHTKATDNEEQRQIILKKFFEKKFSNLDEEVVVSSVVPSKTTESIPSPKKTVLY